MEIALLNHKLFICCLYAHDCSCLTKCPMGIIGVSTSCTWFLTLRHPWIWRQSTCCHCTFGLRFWHNLGRKKKKHSQSAAPTWRANAGCIYIYLQSIYIYVYIGPVVHGGSLPSALSDGQKSPNYMEGGNIPNSSSTVDCLEYTSGQLWKMNATLLFACHTSSSSIIIITTSITIIIINNNTIVYDDTALLFYKFLTVAIGKA